MLSKEQQKKAAEILEVYSEAMGADLPPSDLIELKEISKQLDNGIKCDTKKCESGKVTEKPVKEKKKRAPTARGTFMGYCMKGVAKGGEGKPMADCSTDWKEMPQELKDTYIEED